MSDRVAWTFDPTDVLALPIWVAAAIGALVVGHLPAGMGSPTGRAAASYTVARLALVRDRHADRRAGRRSRGRSSGAA